MDEFNSTDSRISVDAFDVLYLHAFDNPGMILVSKAFDGLGYGSWKRAMEIALCAKIKLGFVNGDCKEPRSTFVELSRWERCNSMVISCILNALDKEILESVDFTTTS